MNELKDEKNLFPEPCPICGAKREQRADGQLIHALHTGVTWTLHYKAYEEEAKKSILQTREAAGKTSPVNPPLGGWYS